MNIGVGPEPHNEAETFKKQWPNIRIVGLEPHVHVFKQRHGNYPGKLYQWGLWSIPCLKILTVVRQSKGKSSILKPDERWVGKWSYKNEKVCSQEIISCITLDQLDEALEFPEDIFLWMDIEGSELEALKGGHKLLESGRVQWIDMEVSVKPRRLGEPSEDDLSDHLKNYRFSIKQRYNIGTHFQNVVYTTTNNVFADIALHTKGQK